jgi:site-specific DNA recombinase
MKPLPTSVQKTAVDYCRVSTNEQAKGLSIDGQKDVNRKFCRDNNIILLKSFSDVTTGTNFDRKGLDSLKDFCKKNKPHYILVWRWDRLGRNAVETLLTIKYFEKNKIQVNSVTQWKENDSADENFMLQLQTILAERESKVTSERTKMSIRFSNESGFWLNRAPIGYKRSNTLDERGKRTIEVSDNGAFIVREVFRLFIAGMDKMKIRENLMETHAEKIKMLNFGFSRTAIRRILTNPFYLGKLILKDKNGDFEKLIDAKHPAIVEQTTFDAAQYRIAELEGKHGRDAYQERDEYPLKSSLLCPHCFVPLRAYAVKKKLKKTDGVQEIHYYDCKESHFRIQTKIAHQIVLDALFEIELSQIDKAEMQKTVKIKIDALLSTITSVKQALEKQITEITANLEKLDGLLLTGLSVENYERMSSQLKKQLIDKQFEWAQSDGAIDFQEEVFKNALDLMTDLGSVYKSATGELQKKIIKTLFPAGLFIDPKNNEVLTFFLNSFAVAIRSKSMSYERLKIVKSLPVPFCSLYGTQIEPKSVQKSVEIRLLNEYICAKR